MTTLPRTVVFSVSPVLISLMVVALLAVVGSSRASDPAGTLVQALTFYASFDSGVEADFSKGDPGLYTMMRQRPPVEAKAGLHTDDKTTIAKGEGLAGDALRFTDREARWLFYKAERNLPFARKDWGGTVSLWLRVDPRTELAPGYCDPIQITPRKWNDAAFFVDFDKEGDPRDFRLGVFADLAVWNASNRRVDDIPDEARPLLKVHNPPFAGDKWTHVVFTWDDFNTGKKDGVAKLYLDGKPRGELTGWEQSFGWKAEEESRILIGLNYIGLFDELSCFGRALKEEEVRKLYGIKGGLLALRASLAPAPPRNLSVIVK